ncbi:MAG: hypothetical protein M1823_009176, partial [Watsoniomyces obsoletus]
HRRTHETQGADGHPTSSNSEEELENDENEFGDVDDDLSSPEEPPSADGFSRPLNTSMPPPSSGFMQPMPQPMMAPSQLVQPQLLQHTI